MIWAEIKKALNSTLGTNKFKPLDEMLEEIKNNYHIIPSGTRIGDFDKEYTVNYDGKIEAVLQCQRRNPNIQSPPSVTVEVVKNSTVEKYTFRMDAEQYEDDVGNILIDVNKGDKIMIKTPPSITDVVTIRECWIVGSVVQGDVPLAPSPLE